MPNRASGGLPWHRRLEANVAAGLALLIAAAIAAFLLITVRLTSNESRARAADEMAAARDAFYSRVDERADTAQAFTRLVTQLPIFRAHLTDSQLAADGETIAAMADGYRAELGASFAVVSDRTGRWLASPGLNSTTSATAGEARPLIAGALAGEERSGLALLDDRVVLVVAVPARFADEVLGVLAVGFTLTDEFAADVAGQLQTDLILTWEDRVTASSLTGDARAAAARFVPELRSRPEGVSAGLVEAAGRQFVAGRFAFAPGRFDSRAGIVLLADWQRTQSFIDTLRLDFLLAGVAILLLAIGIGLLVSRRLTRPLREIAVAAREIADGNLALKLPDYGTAEASAVARAFNDMSVNLQIAHDRLVHDAIHDHLTQLPNRVLFSERVERAMARRLRHPDFLFAVLFIDIDRFKHVNDSLGHAAGDALLVEVARRLGTAVRNQDMVVRAQPPDLSPDHVHTLARFGGDEFVMLLDDIRHARDAVRVAERIQRLFSDACEVAGREVFASPSIGVAISTESHHAAADVIRDADAAMYRAKREGGARYVVFDVSMHQAAVDSLEMETDLRYAIERGEFALFYQPIVSLKTGLVAGYEALVRWRHPTRGLLAPGAFLAAAEDLGLVTAIDRWALDEACRQAAIWRTLRAEGPLPHVSVNLSARSLADDQLTAHVEAALTHAGLAPESLHLEVTESTAVSHADRVKAVLGDLRNHGVKISLDDFGTGYCSLSYLQQFPVDTLKIDRSFVTRIGEYGGRTEIVNLLAQLAHTLGLEVVAEGTETLAQVDYLSGLGCEYAQGYYFSRPVDAEAATALETAGARWPEVTARHAVA